MLQILHPHPRNLPCHPRLGRSESTFSRPSHTDRCCAVPAGARTTIISRCSPHDLKIVSISRSQERDCLDLKISRDNLEIVQATAKSAANNPHGSATLPQRFRVRNSRENLRERKSSNRPTDPLSKLAALHHLSLTRTQKTVVYLAVGKHHSAELIDFNRLGVVGVHEVEQPGALCVSMLARVYPRVSEQPSIRRPPEPSQHNASTARTSTHATSVPARLASRAGVERREYAEAHK
jgi:hypothetical protein